MIELEAVVERFLRRQPVARLATVDASGRPHVVPVVFVLDAGRVYTPIDRKPKSVGARELRRVRNIVPNPQAQVLVDRYDEDWRRLGYVQLRGQARLLETGEELARALALLERKYEQYAELPLDGGPVIRLDVERVVTWGALD